MCVVSMVHDHFAPQFPPNVFDNIAKPVTTGVMTWPLTQLSPITPEDVENLRTLIRVFRAAKDAAEVVDKLTAQPDCVDPEKAQLEARVAELERRLDAIAGAAASK